MKLGEKIRAIREAKHLSKAQFAKELHTSDTWIGAIESGKGSKERIVPIHPRLRVYLRKASKEGYLFLNPKTGRPWQDFKKALQRASDKAGISQHVYMHLLRHSFGTHSIQSGIGLRTLQMLMGHSSSQVTEIYTTLAGQYLGQEIEKFGRGAMRHSKQPKKPKKP